MAVVRQGSEETLGKVVDIYDGTGAAFGRLVCTARIF